MWRVVETEIISYARSEHHLTQTQCETNRKYTDMMKQVVCLIRQREGGPTLKREWRHLSCVDPFVTCSKDRPVRIICEGDA